MRSKWKMKRMSAMLLLGCAYADGCFTAEETILAAYFRGKCIQESNLPPGRHSHRYRKPYLSFAKVVWPLLV